MVLKICRTCIKLRLVGLDEMGGNGGTGGGSGADSHKNLLYASLNRFVIAKFAKEKQSLPVKR